MSAKMHPTGSIMLGIMGRHRGSLSIIITAKPSPGYPTYQYLCLEFKPLDFSRQIVVNRVELFHVCIDRYASKDLPEGIEDTIQAMKPGDVVGKVASIRLDHGEYTGIVTQQHENSTYSGAFFKTKQDHQQDGNAPLITCYQFENIPEQDIVVTDMSLFA